MKLEERERKDSTRQQTVSNLPSPPSSYILSEDRISYIFTAVAFGISITITTTITS